MPLNIDAKLILEVLTLELVTKEAQPGIGIDVRILHAPVIWLVMQILPVVSLIKS